MNREAASRWCEHGIAALVLAMLVFAVLATGAVRTVDLLIVQWMAAGVLLLWLLRLWIEEKPRFFWPPICWAVLGFTLYAVARYITADIEYVARLELLRVLIYAAMFFAILNNLQRPETMTLIVRVMVFLAMAVAGYAVYQYVTGDNRVWTFINPYEHRGSGTYINPNHLAGFLELILPVGLAYVLVGRGRKPVLNIFTGYALLVMAAGLAVSFSRGGWISTVLALTLLCGVLVFHGRRRWPAVAALALGVLLSITFFTENLHSKQRLARIFSSGEVNTELRTALWRPAFQMWKENVWFGVGPAHFDYRFGQYRPAVVQERPDRVHNDYLNALTDWGIVGVILVVSVWVLAGIGVVRTWRRLNRSGEVGSDGSDRLAFVLGASCGLLAILIHSLADFNMHIPANAMIVVTWLALLTSQLRYTSHRAWTSSPVLVRGVGSGMLVACAGWLIWQGQLGAREYKWRQRAAKAEWHSDERIEDLRRAFAIDPMNFDVAYDIGEAYRVRSWEGGAEYASETEAALKWFGRSMKLDPHDSNAPLRYAMCLDWLGQSSKAEHYYRLADQLDPRSFYVAAYMGWHFLWIRDYPAAQSWFERSKRLQWKDNEMADQYLRIIRERMLEAATNPLAPPLLTR